MHRVVSSDLIVRHALVFWRILFVKELVGDDVFQRSKVSIATCWLCLRILIEAWVLLRLCLNILLAFVFLFLVPFALLCRLLIDVFGLQVWTAVISNKVISLLRWVEYTPISLDSSLVRSRVCKCGLAVSSNQLDWILGVWIGLSAVSFGVFHFKNYYNSN